MILLNRQQLNELTTSGIDFLIAEILLASGEALCIARCRAETDLSDALSSVVRREGTLLDKSLLDSVIEQIDA